MKKLTALFLSLTLLITLTACSGSDTQNTTGSESKSDTTNSSPVDGKETEGLDKDSKYPIVEEEITVRGVVVGKDTSIREDRLVWNKVSEITGINIVWENIDTEALATSLAGGDWPDFIHHALDNSLVNDYGVIGGRFVNYLDYLEYMPNLVATIEDYPMIQPAATQINGEMYNLPGIEASSTVVSARPYVRTDVLKDAGLEMPLSTEEFYNALVTLKEKNGVPGFVPELSNDESYWGPMIFAAFGTLTNMNFDDDGNGNVVYNRTSEQMKHYFEFMHKLYAEELIHQEFLTMDGTVRFDLAKSGNVAFIGGGEGNSLQATDFPSGEFDLDCNPPLISEYDDTQEIVGKSGYYSNGFFMNSESDYVVELCQMFDIMYATEEVVEGSGLHGMSFCYGLEGVDWDYGPEGSGLYIFHTPEKYDGAFTPYQYGEIIWDNAGRTDALAGLVTETVSNSRARQLGFVSNVIPYQAELYFPVNLLKFTDDEQYTLDNYLTDIKIYSKEMEGKFITGVADIESGWDEYVDNLDKMGLDNVIEVYQTAYDRWNGK